MRLNFIELQLTTVKLLVNNFGTREKEKIAGGGIKKDSLFYYIIIFLICQAENGNENWEDGLGWGAHHTLPILAISQLILFLIIELITSLYFPPLNFYFPSLNKCSTLITFHISSTIRLQIISSK